MRKKIILFWIISVLSLSGNCNNAFAAGPWKGKIIDVETKEPLEGAVVLAVWERVYRTPAGANSYFYEAKEVVTNKAGEFEMSSYTTINLLPIISYMRGPLFTIFKPGYGSVNGMALGGYFTGVAPEEQDFKLEEKRYRYAAGVVELPKLKTREERLEAQSNAIPLGGVPDEKMPILLSLINVERKSLGLDPTHVRGRRR